MRRWVGCFLALMLFGAVVWGEADELRYRPQWAQWLGLAFWTVIAAIILNLVLDGAYKAGAERMEQEKNEQLERWLADGVIVEGERQG